VCSSDLSFFSKILPLIETSEILFFLFIEHEEFQMENLPGIMLPGEKFEVNILKGELNKDLFKKFRVNNLNQYLCNM